MPYFIEIFFKSCPLIFNLLADGGSDFVGELEHQAFGDAGVGAEDIAVVDSAATGNHLGAVTETAEVEETLVGDMLECHLAVKRVGGGRDGDRAGLLQGSAARFQL